MSREIIKRVKMKVFYRSLLVLFAGSSLLMAASGTTVSGNPACLKNEWLKDITTFIVENDRKSIDYYIKSNKCISLKDGIEVIAVKRESFGTVSFVYEGIKFWTNVEAVKIK